MINKRDAEDEQESEHLKGNDERPKANSPTVGGERCTIGHGDGMGEE